MRSQAGPALLPGQLPMMEMANTATLPAMPESAPRYSVFDDGVNLLIFLSATFGTWFAQQFDRPITAVVVYLTGVMFIGARSGLKRGLTAAITAAFIYNFALSDPVLRFGVSTLDELVPLIAFTVSALVTGILAGRLTDKATAALTAQIENAKLLEQLYEARTREKSEELKDAIFSSVSHDLRTPLTAIEAAADSLIASELELTPEQRRSLLQTISRQCQRLNRYTADLLNVGRIQSGISPDAFTELDVVEIVGVSLGRLRTIYPQATIEKFFESGQATVSGKGAMLDQAIFNVLDNAIVHGGDESKLSVRVKTVEDECRIEVVDNGPGIPQIEQRRVFVRFHRGYRTETTRGSGLGLFISRGFVEAFSGRIELESPVASGRGTKVSIVLPLVDRHAQESRAS